MKNTVRKILVPLIPFVRSIATAKARILISSTDTMVNNAVNPKGMYKCRVIQYFKIVFQSDKLCIRYRRELTKGKIDSQKKWS